MPPEWLGFCLTSPGSSSVSWVAVDRDLILTELIPLLELKGSISDLDRLRQLLG
jgi:hypothetical protein